MPELLAIIEIGSNAVRFSLARVTPGLDFQVLQNWRAQTRLGSGRSGHLPEEAVERTVGAVRRFVCDVRHLDNLRVIAVATAALRDATNGHRLVEPLRELDGVDVQVLSADEEARLGAAAAQWSLSVRDGLVVDLGGGSLQMTQVRAGEVAPIGSVPLGAVRLTRRFLEHDPPTPAELRALRGESREWLASLLPREHRDTPLVGLGGTIRTLGRIYRAARSPLHGCRIPRPAVGEIVGQLQALPAGRRRRVRGLRPERADIIVAGAIVIEELMTLGDYPTLTVCALSIRHGLLVRETFGEAFRP